jgi:predicted ATPase
MRQGIAMCGEQAICVQVPLFKARQAEGEAETGHVESALAMADEAIALSERTSHHSFDAELHRVRGDMLLRANRLDIDAAEAALMRAEEIAHAHAQVPWSGGLRH